MLHFPYRSIHRSSDFDVTFKSCCKHARDGIGNLIYSTYKHQCLCRLSVCVCLCVSCIGAHTDHPLAMKLSQVVVNMPAVVLEIKKNLCNSHLRLSVILKTLTLTGQEFLVV